MVSRARIARSKAGLVVAAAALSLAACATAPPPASMPGLTSMPRLADGRPRAFNRPYQVRGRWYTPADQPGYDKVGLASWYSYESPSRTTADGERFDIRIPTAAHPTLPIPSWLEVTNLDNGRSLRVRLNDRGPFVSSRILDVSRGAAEQLGFLQRGTARVRVRYLGPAEPLGGGETPPCGLVRIRPRDACVRRLPRSCWPGRMSGRGRPASLRPLRSPRTPAKCPTMVRRRWRRLSPSRAGQDRPH